jgi:hypothetical protein
MCKSRLSKNKWWEQTKWEVIDWKIAVNMKYLCNTDVVIDKNVILNTEYIQS